MAYSSEKPVVTPKYHIEVPTHEYYATPCIAKVWFGRKHYIIKCKSLLPSMENMAELIERTLRTGKYDESHLFYHVITYIKKARIIQGKVEMIENDFEKREWEMLKTEQLLLDKHKNDETCLNNNFDAYIPKWIPADQIERFNKWRNETRKGNRTKNRASNSRKKHKGGQLAVRRKR